MHRNQQSFLSNIFFSCASHSSWHICTRIRFRTPKSWGSNSSLILFFPSSVFTFVFTLVVSFHSISRAGSHGSQRSETHFAVEIKRKRVTLGNPQICGLTAIFFRRQSKGAKNGKTQQKKPRRRGRRPWKLIPNYLDTKTQRQMFFLLPERLKFFFLIILLSFFVGPSHPLRSRK